MQFTHGQCNNCGVLLKGPGYSFMHWGAICPRCYSQNIELFDAPRSRAKKPERDVGDALERLKEADGVLR